MSASKKRTDNEFVQGSGNVFADLGIANATIHKLKTDLAIKLNELLDAQQSSQMGLAEKLGLQQPHISQIRHYKLKGFSIERLMELIVKLGLPVEIQIGEHRSECAQLRVTTKVSRLRTRAYGDFVNDSAKVWKPVYLGNAVLRGQDAAQETFGDAILPTQKVTATFDKNRVLQ